MEEAPIAAPVAEAPNAISEGRVSNKEPTERGDEHDGRQSDQKQVSAWSEIRFVFRV